MLDKGIDEVLIPHPSPQPLSPRGEGHELLWSFLKLKKVAVIESLQSPSPGGVGEATSGIYIQRLLR